MRGVTQLSGSFETYFTQQGDPDYLIEARRKAMRSYESLDIPRFEKSDLTHRNLAAFKIEAAAAGNTWQAIADPYLAQDGQSSVLVIADGQVVLKRGLEQVEANGAVFTNLRSAAVSHRKLVEKHLGTAVSYDENQLISLQTALWRDGAFIYVPSGVTLTEPLQLICVTTASGHGSFPRNLIIAEASSAVTLYDAYLAAETITDELHVGVTEVVVGPDAHVVVGSVQDFPKAATTILSRRANVGKNGRMDWVFGELSEGFTVADFGSVLQGDGSKSTSHAIAVGIGRAHIDMTARMIHIGRFSESDTMARGVMQGRSNGVYRGFTQIHKGASGSDGQQTEKLLMLSPQSRADAIPMLLIDENDVKCGHAASVGQISEDQLFYLMSRGISERDAKAMIVWGFLQPVLAEISIERMREAVTSMLERKMA